MASNNQKPRRTNRLRLLPDRRAERILRIMGDRVSALWNAANYCCRQAFLAGRKVPGYAGLCSTFREHEAYRALPAHVGQEVLKKLSEAWKSYFALRKQWRAGKIQDKPGLPHYRKHKDGSRPADWVPIKSTNAYAVDSHQVAITLPADLRDNGRLIIPYRGCCRYQGPMMSADMHFDAGRGRWYFHYRVECEANRLKSWTREAALDLGVRVAASLSIDGLGAAIHYLGREILKDWDYWGRRIAAHMSEVSHRPKGKRSSKRLRRLYRKRRARWEQAWEALAARIVAVLKANRVGCLYIGWPKDIRRDQNYGRRWNGRIHNFWSFDKASQIVERHCVRAGIRAKRVGERGSSSTCPQCGSRHVVRQPRHVLSCKACGLVIHSDQAGSRNILRIQNPQANFLKIPGQSRDRAEAAPKPETYRWNRHRWVDASNPLSLERLTA